MSAWLWQDRPFGNYYLSTNVGGKRAFRNLKTKDPAAARAELERVRAEQSARPWPTGNIRWQPEDWQKFSGLRGQTRVSMQSYALTAHAMGILSDAERWAWLLKPAPRTTTLAELGRIQNLEIMRLAADELCERKLCSKAEVAFLRNIRGRHHPAKQTTLPDAIRRAIKAHCIRHPETANDQIAQALRTLAADFK